MMVQPVNSESESRPTRSPLAGLVASMVRFYQRLTVGRASPCRFTPGCSTYALEAVETHGAFRGSWLAARRLIRCHPWGGHGFDPVPDRHPNDPKFH
jgi:uncharacterized protein